MDLAGIIATWDALNTQPKNVKVVISGDYIIPIKENQKNFYNNLKLYFDEKRCEEIIVGNSSSVYYTEKSHSSYIKYE